MQEEVEVPLGAQMEQMVGIGFGWNKWWGGVRGRLLVRGRREWAWLASLHFLSRSPSGGMKYPGRRGWELPVGKGLLVAAG